MQVGNVFFGLQDVGVYQVGVDVVDVVGIDFVFVLSYFVVVCEVGFWWVVFIDDEMDFGWCGFYDIGDLCSFSRWQFRYFYSGRLGSKGGVEGVDGFWYFLCISEVMDFL